jgi:hypothetical protein
MYQQNNSKYILIIQSVNYEKIMSMSKYNTTLNVMKVMNENTTKLIEK